MRENEIGLVTYVALKFDLHTAPSRFPPKRRALKPQINHKTVMNPHFVKFIQQHAA